MKCSGSIYLSIFLSIYLSIHLSIHRIYLFIYLSIYLSVYLSIYLSFGLSFGLSIYLSINQSINQSFFYLTSLMNMSFVLRLPRKIRLCRSSANVPCLPSFVEMLQNPHVLRTFDKIHNLVRLPRDPQSLMNISCASKSGPNPKCFEHFYFEMSFAPQRLALFQHLNFQKWSENGVFCTF